MSRYVYIRIIAHSSPSQVSPMTCFRRKRMHSILTATISSVSCYLPTIHLIQCPGLSPDSLVQQNKNACLRLQQKFCYKLRSRICHKSRSNIKLYFHSPVYYRFQYFWLVCSSSSASLDSGFLKKSRYTACTAGFSWLNRNVLATSKA